MKHPTITQLKKFFHDRLAIKSHLEIFTHIMTCRKCSRKFARLKVKYKYRHKNTDYKNYKDLSSKALERISVCYGVCVFVSWRLDSISSLEDMAWYMNAVAMLEEDIGIENPEKYLNYNTLEEAWLAFTEPAHWLSEMEIEERFFLFRDLARMFILVWDKEDPQSKCPIYIPDQIVLCITDELGIPEDDAYAIGEEELWDVQKFWKNLEREKNNAE